MLCILYVRGFQREVHDDNVDLRERKKCEMCWFMPLESDLRREKETFF